MRLQEAELFAFTAPNEPNALTTGKSPQIRGWVGGAVAAWSRQRQTLHPSLVLPRLSLNTNVQVNVEE